MKTKIVPSPPSPPVFDPVTIEITFERQEEANALFALLNYCSLGKAVNKHENLEPLYQQLLSIKSEAYHSFHMALSELIHGVHDNV